MGLNRKIIYEKRVKSLAEKASESDIGLLLITGRGNVEYLTGFRGPAVLLLEEGGFKLMVPRLEYERALDECAGGEIIAYLPYNLPLPPSKHLFKGKLKDLLLEELKGRKGKVGLIGKFDFTLIRGLASVLKEVEVVDANPLISDLRSVKEPWEIELIKEATRVAESALVKVLDHAKEGVREYEIAAELIYEIRRRGAQPSFEPIIASGRNSSFPHAIPGDKTLKSGEWLVIDVGARLKGYCSDLTRTLVVGGLGGSKRRLIELVLEAQDSAVERLKSGSLASEVDEAARSVIEREGLGGYFIHSLGHGIGLEVHEEPLLAPDSEKRLKENMVVTIEPGIYLKEGGVRIEDMFVVREGGCERLTSLERIIL